MQTAKALLGLVLVLFVLLEAFEALVLPRRVLRPFRFTRLYYRNIWWLWLAAARLCAAGHRRQTFLSLFGPLSLFVLFAFWAAALIVGFGLGHNAVAPAGVNLIDSMYLSGTTFTTLGYGDLTPATPAARALSVVEAATGFGFFAVVISYLPVLYQAFSSREAFIALLDSRAGSPPAAGRLLLRTPPLADGGSCLTGFLTEAERWTATVLEGHLSFPVLGYYRSQHDNQSWLAALTCTLDTTALLLTVVEGGSRTQARLTFAMARHAVVDLGLVIRRQPKAPVEDRLPPARLTELLAALRTAGVKVRDDDGARAKLEELRELYEPFLAGLGTFFRLPVPVVWPTEEGPDNWRTSAWVRRAGPLTSLGIDPKDDHFS
ncbi:potassium channel family protein [Fimbriiglobus ruber]|uniref:K+ channel, pore region n=1 Tax=Fimbriiglobus ruber TaxID=1908690 RepID=A0A225DHP5_9BACT|nr:potassium channel family protein [Fimbriiglobus ruber]OWK36966.1 K+ channel, pore region [Fimbriiglobus ruber]